MKLSIEQIPTETPKEVTIRCHDAKAPWVKAVQGVTAGQLTVNAARNDRTYRLRLNDIYYFEVVDGTSFLYCQKEVFSCRQKLYEFEALCSGSMLFRCVNP